MKTFCSNIQKKSFIEASLKALDKYHPGWDEWDPEQTDFSKLDRNTIMIPPSYDLFKHFLGPTEAGIAGFDSDQCRNKKVEIHDQT